MQAIMPTCPGAAVLAAALACYLAAHRRSLLPGLICHRQLFSQFSTMPQQQWIALSSLTLGTLYQQGWPLRVIDPSMMSSATRKKACNYRSNTQNAVSTLSLAGTWHSSISPSPGSCLWRQVDAANTCCSTFSQSWWLELNIPMLWTILIKLMQGCRPRSRRSNILDSFSSRLPLQVKGMRSYPTLCACTRPCLQRHRCAGVLPTCANKHNVVTFAMSYVP